MKAGWQMKILYAVLLGMLLSVSPAAAQYSAQNEAKYMATLKAVVDFKINDEENYRDIESLRQNKRFNEDLMKMLGKLSNRRNKNSTNNRVYRILLQAGKEVYNELN